MKMLAQDHIGHEQDHTGHAQMQEVIKRKYLSFSREDMLSKALFLCWGAFAALLLSIIFVLRLKILTSGPRRIDFLANAVLFELCVLTVIAPLAIETMILIKQRFWAHYAQFFAPFVSIGAVSFAVLLYRTNPRYLNFVVGRKVVAIMLAFVLVSGPVSNLKTKFRHYQADLTPQNVIALLEKHGPAGGFLAPYHMYPHWKLNHHRHGFPHATHTHRINIGA